jgi:hypothetical protein
LTRSPDGAQRNPGTAAQCHHHSRISLALHPGYKSYAAAREISMTVYVDDAIWNWQGLKWCHLMADDMDELHQFAARLGIHRNSYQGPPRTSAPHYDLTCFERIHALALGAKACSRAEIVTVFRAVRHARGNLSAICRASR